MRSFYGSFSKFDTVRQELRWTHYRLPAMFDSNERKIGYMEECVNNNSLITTGFSQNLILAIKKTVKEFLTMHR